MKVRYVDGDERWRLSIGDVAPSDIDRLLKIVGQRELLVTLANMYFRKAIEKRGLMVIFRALIETTDRDKILLALIGDFHVRNRPDGLSILETYTPDSKGDEEFFINRNKKILLVVPAGTIEYMVYTWFTEGTQRVSFAVLREETKDETWFSAHVESENKHIVDLFKTYFEEGGIRFVD